jgi:hypothetical protein
MDLANSSSTHDAQVTISQLLFSALIADREKLKIITTLVKDEKSDYGDYKILKRILE